MKQFTMFLNESIFAPGSRKRTHETRHGIVTVHPWIKDSAWRVKHPEAPDHFAQVIKKRELYAGEIKPSERWKVEVRKSNGDLTGDEAHTGNKKSAINMGAYFLNRTYRKT